MLFPGEIFVVLETFVTEKQAIQGTSGSVVVGKVTALKHEFGNYAMEGAKRHTLLQA